MITIKETGEKFEDGAHIIYVNGSYQDDSPLGLLMKDFACSNPKDMYYKILAGVGVMCKAVEELCKEEVLEIVERMFALGTLTIEEIVLISGLTLEEVKEIEKQRKI